jgi:glutamyl-Q tRNA(Asp) synthetase
LIPDPGATAPGASSPIPALARDRPMRKSLLSHSDPTAVPSGNYTGRFAPSPTGPLHFGSLVSALGSFLHARAQGGRWLVRMEDIDPPREQPGAAEAILLCLEAHQLLWDGLLYQSQRGAAYEETLVKLDSLGLLYACDCTRQDLHTMGGIYQGRCRHRQVDRRQPHALRLRLYPDQPGDADWLEFEDLFQGRQRQNLRQTVGDPILKRKDGLYAYQLAVVADDLFQQITHVIRGQDLLEVTARQIALFRLLEAEAPVYGHLPLALNAQGQKLSKQNLALALDNRCATNNLWQALVFLGQNPPAELTGAEPGELLAWATANWQPEQLASLGNRLAPANHCHPLRTDLS